MRQQFVFEKSALNLTLAAGCGSCNTTTAIDDFPAAIQGVNTGLSVRRGGITGIAFLKCNSPFTDVLDQQEWQDKIDGLPGPPPVAPSLLVRKNCYIGAEKTGEPQTVEVGACQTVILTGIDYTVTVTDSGDNSNNDVFNFWAHIQEHPLDYLVAFIDCDGRVYPFVKASIQAVHGIEGTNAGLTTWTATINYKTTKDAPPLALTWSINDLVIN